MKQTILTVICGLIILPSFAQTVENAPLTYQDSLAGFDRSSFQLKCGIEHDSATEAAEIAAAERRYIDYKYKLGIFSPDYVYPGIVTNNPVNPVAACTNVDFETGDFTGWSGLIGDNMTSCFAPFSNPQNGIFSTTIDAPVSNSNARHTLITPAYGNDPFGGFPGVPPGSGGYTVRMGGQTPNYQGEVLEQTFTVDPASTSFAYRYAVVFNDPPSGHLPTNKPYFRIEVLDATGQPISTCTQYFDTSHVGSAGYVQSTVPNPVNFDPILYKPWTTVNFDLSAYVNQNITVRFTVAGCTQSGHFGYCYFDCSCSALAASINFCPGNTFLYLTAPDGYAGYQWLDPNHTPIPGATNDTLFVNNPVVGDTFFVYLTSMADTSCHNTLPVVLEYTHIFPNAASTDETCWRFNDGTATASGTMGFAPYSYSWNTVPPQNTQTATGLSPGTYIVHMVDSLGCENWDTVEVAEALRLDTSMFTYNYCYDDAHTYITAPAGYTNYTWLGPTGDTLPTPSPSNVLYVTGPQMGDMYWCILQSPPACPVYDSVVLGFNPPLMYFLSDTLVNIFTPNGDGLNDFFYPYYDYTIAGQTSVNSQPAYDFFTLYIHTYEIWIYDRWGEEMFYSNDYKYGWDGMHNKKEANEGTYYYITRYTSACDPTATPIENHGFLTLKR